MTNTLDFFKQPIALGLITGTITYIYLYYKNKQNISKKKIDNLNYSIISKIPIYIPIGVAFTVWILSTYFLNSNKINSIKNNDIENIISEISQELTIGKSKNGEDDVFMSLWN